jgi:hypothetical protein
MPRRKEIPEEGWGGFRDTWYLGQISPSEAREAVAYEQEALDRLDYASSNQKEFELLAYALEWGETIDLPSALLEKFNNHGLKELMRDPDDFSPLGGLEIGVAGLVHALAAVGCVTAASCRWHGERSWSDCPVVVFAAPAWKIGTLTELFRENGCGLVGDRGLLWVEAASVADLHSLAGRIIKTRSRLRKPPPVP